MSHAAGAESGVNLFKKGAQVPTHQLVVAGAKKKVIESKGESPPSFDEIIQSASSNEESIKSNEDDVQKVTQEATEDLLAALSWGEGMLPIQQRDKMKYFTKKGWNLFKKNIWPAYYQQLGDTVKQIKLIPIDQGKRLAQANDSFSLGLMVSMERLTDKGVTKLSLRTLARLKKEPSAWLIDHIIFQPILN